MPSIRHPIRSALAVAALILSAAHLAAAPPGAASPTQTTATAPQAAAAKAEADYVGEATCLSCHDTKSYNGTAHALKTNPRTPAATHGCESCHGPGKAHVDTGGDTSKIVNPLNLSPREASETCLRCHDRGKHPLVPESQHDQGSSGCLTCHKVHAAKGQERMKAASRHL